VISTDGLFAPPEVKLLKELNNFAEAIEACRDKHLTVQALILLYH
jgi:hypothetical protein